MSLEILMISISPPRRRPSFFGGNKQANARWVNHRGLFQIKNDLFLTLIYKTKKIMSQIIAAGSDYVNSWGDFYGAIFFYYVTHDVSLWGMNKWAGSIPKFNEEPLCSDIKSFLYHCSACCSCIAGGRKLLGHSFLMVLQVCGWQSAASQNLHP